MTSGTKRKRAAAALRAWREREKLTLAAAADRLDLNSAQVWWSWEHIEENPGPNHHDKRPSLEHALELDQLTLGAVRFEWWGFPGRILATMAHIAQQRATEHGRT